MTMGVFLFLDWEDKRYCMPSTARARLRVLEQQHSAGGKGLSYEHYVVLYSYVWFWLCCAWFSNYFLEAFVSKKRPAIL